MKIRDGGQGMHARPASVFVQTASKFNSEIKVIKDEVEVNGKSIMGLMMLALSPGSEFKIIADGNDEDLAIDALIDLVRNDFINPKK
jgi:phosphocarrier protein HPr